MSKYETYKQQPRDFWRTTDPDAVRPLVPYVSGKTYAEPCFGAGDLIRQLNGVADCKWASDIDPQIKGYQRNALTLTKEDLEDCDYIITNPPFLWSMLRPLLEHLPTLKPTWLLLPSDIMHNIRVGPYIKNCSRIVSVGRLYFHTSGQDEGTIKHAKQTSNYCWYFFPQGGNEYPTHFVGR